MIKIVCFLFILAKDYKDFKKLGSSHSSLYNTNSKNNSINNSRISDKIRDITNYTLTDNENENENEIDNENDTINDYDISKDKEKIMNSDLNNTYKEENSKKSKVDNIILEEINNNQDEFRKFYMEMNKKLSNIK